MLSSFTAPQCVYRLLQFNIAALTVSFINKDLISFLIRHKDRAQIVFMISALMLFWFIQTGYNDYKDRGDAPLEELELLVWKKDGHKLERDIYLGLATLISSCFLYSIAYQTDKFDRYMSYKLQQDKESAKAAAAKVADVTPAPEKPTEI